MSAIESITLESDSLAPAELNRLVDERGREFETLTVTSDEPSQRMLDPTIASAMVTGAATLLAPFVAALIDRLFKKEPQAAVALGADDDPNRVVVTASMPAAQRTKIVTEAISAGAARVKISVDVLPG